MAGNSMVVRIAGDLSELRRTLAEGTSAITTTTAAMSKLAGSLNSGPLIQRAHNVVAAINKVGVSTLTASQSATQLKVLDAAMAKLALTGKPIPADMQRMAAALRSMAPPVKTLEARMAALANKVNTFGQAARTIGVGFTAAFTAPIVGFGVASVKAFADFDQAMTNSTAIMGNVSDQMKGEMSDAAREVGRTTTFSATEAAEAYFFLASAGLDAASSIAAMPKVASFAQAGNFSLALATDLLTDAQSALGLTIRDDVVENMANMVHVSDVLVKANTLANASVQQFSVALTTKAGNAMKQLNIDIESGVAVLAAWADQGIKGTLAGERFNMVTRDLQKAVMKNGEEFKRLNIAVFDSQGNFRNMSDITEDLEKNLLGMSAEQQNATLASLGFTSKTISATRSLVGLSGSIRDYESSLRDAAGITDEVAAKQLESFSAALSLAWGKVVDLGIEIGGTLAPMILKLVDAMDPAIDRLQSLARSFTESSRTTKIVIIGVLGLMAAIGPLLVAVGMLGMALGPIITAYGLWAGASATAVAAAGPATAGLAATGTAAAASTGMLAGLVAVMTGPVGLTVAAVALAAGVLYATDGLGDIKEAAEDAGGILSSLATIVATEATIQFNQFAESAGYIMEQLDKLKLSTDDYGGATSAAVAEANPFLGVLNLFGGVLPVVDKFLSDVAASSMRAKDDMQGFISGTSNAANGVSAALALVGPAFIRSSTETARLAAEALALKNEMEETAAAAENMSKAVQSLADSMGKDGLEAAQVFEKAVEAVGGVSTLTQGNIDKYAKTLDEVIEQYRLFGPAGAAIVAHFEEVRDTLPQTTEEMKQAAEQLKFMNKEWSAMQVLLSSTQKTMANFADATSPRLRGLLDQAIQVPPVMAMGSAGLVKFVESLNLSDHDKMMNFFGPLAPDKIPSTLGAIKGALSDMPNVIMSAITGGGDVAGAIGGSIFGKIFDPAGGLVTKATSKLTGALGSTIGGALGSVLPGIGTLLGSQAGKLLTPLVGKVGSFFSGMFGKSQGRKDLEAANEVIHKYQRELLATHGSLEGIREAGGAAGVELANAWGSQNVKGLEHFKNLMDEFGKSIETAAKETERLAEETKRLAEEQEELERIARGTMDAMTTDLERLQARYDNVASVEKMEKALADMAAGGGLDLRTLTRSIEDMKKSLGASNPVVQRLEQIMAHFAATGILDVDALALAFADLRGEMELPIVPKIVVPDVPPIDIPINVIMPTAAFLRDFLNASLFEQNEASDWSDEQVRNAVEDFLNNNPGDEGRIPSALGIPASRLNDLGLAGYKQGTPNLGFMDFGAGTPTVLHGREAVVPVDKAQEFAAKVAGGIGHGEHGEEGNHTLATLTRIEASLRRQPRALALAMKEAKALGGR